VIDARGRIVMPGFMIRTITSSRTALPQLLADGVG